jgi:hypothetical protein
MGKKKLISCIKKKPCTKTRMEGRHENNVRENPPPTFPDTLNVSFCNELKLSKWGAVADQMGHIC